MEVRHSGVLMTVILDMLFSQMARELRHSGVPVTVILDSAVAYKMGEVSMVLVGAEGVAESGGIINKLGTYQIALIAHVSRPSP